jgi:hypothetical protein
VTPRCIRPLVALSLALSLAGCFPFGGEDLYEPTPYEPPPPPPPECETDADCAGDDDGDRCTETRCEYGQCNQVTLGSYEDETCECWDDTECGSTSCSAGTCDDHRCVTVLAEAGPAPAPLQVPGDCAEVMCDGETAEPIAVAAASDVPQQQAGDCTVLSCDGIHPEPVATQDPTDVPADLECNTGYCSDYGLGYTPHPDGTECAAGSGFCFEGICLTTCSPTNPAACGDEGLAEPANDSGATPTQYTGAPGACGFVDASDVDWYTFYAEDEDFETDILWVHAWSTAPSVEVCVYVTCSDGSSPGGGCADKLAGPNGSLGCCWTGASQGFAQSWDLDCGTTEDSGTAYVSVRAPGGDACETYAVSMYY